MKRIRKLCWPDNKFYFITTSTFLHFPYFRMYDQKKLVLNRFIEVEEKMKIKINVFSIAMNHFHYFTFLEKGLMYPKLRQLINGGISFQYKKHFSKKYKQMWQSTRAVIIHTEKVYWSVIGYIIGNLLKHREANTFKELYNNEFSGYKSFVDEYGEAVARELVYRVIDVDEDKEACVELDDFKKVGIQDILGSRGLKSFNPN